MVEPQAASSPGPRVDGEAVVFTLPDPGRVLAAVRLEQELGLPGDALDFGYDETVGGWTPAMINLFSILIAIAIAVLVLPYFNALSGLSLTIESLLEQWFLILVLGLWAVGTLLSGAYPALVLSSFKPVMVLKGKRIWK